jgi:hypothetical protein
MPKPSPKPAYRIYESTNGYHTYLWLMIQHVSVTLPGHNNAGYAVQRTSKADTYLLPITIVASVNYRPGFGSDYAAYIGVASPIFTTDSQRVADIAAHGNKIEGALAEHLFRTHLDTRFGKGTIKYRA